MLGLRNVTAIAAAALCCTAAMDAHGQGLRLRGDALAEARSPVGLLVLQAEGEENSWIRAEALVWTGAAGDDADEDGAFGDALLAAIEIVDPKKRGQLRLGRLQVATGAIRPLHIDGASGVARAPYGIQVEAFGGMPVLPRFTDRGYDWVIGARVSERRGDWLTLGASVYREREDHKLADQEIGFDASTRPLPWLDVAARLAYDLIQTGISDAHLSAAARRKKVRVELFAARRSPTRILPATSLFSVIGNVASDQIGTAARWRFAPRLDLSGSAALRVIDGDAGANVWGRALLRLDDRGAGTLLGELRRSHVGDDSFSGARVALRLPLPQKFALSTELELVVPDESADRGSVWPWGLVAASWIPAKRWEIAGAVEAWSSPEYSSAFSALLRISRTWEVKR